MLELVRNVMLAVNFITSTVSTPNVEYCSVGFLSVYIDERI